MISTHDHGLNGPRSHLLGVLIGEALVEQVCQKGGLLFVEEVEILDGQGPEQRL